MTNQETTSQQDIMVYDRKTNQLFKEQVYGDSGVKFLYQTGPGYLLERSILSRRPLSAIYGLYNDSSWSARRIPWFVKRFQIPMDDFVVPQGGFSSFNEFFIRKYKVGKREFPKTTSVLGSPAEGRVFAFDKISSDSFFPIKGQSLQLGTLLGSADWAKKYHGGAGFVVRLCPVDYHRYHFPDSGIAEAAQRITGRYHSVNPIALRKRPQLFQENERMVTLFKSDHFGTLALVEVAALCVGRMSQTYLPGSSVQRGQEKGYFTFGASTCVLFVEPNRLKISPDLLAHTQSGYETYVALGEPLGHA